MDDYHTNFSIDDFSSPIQTKDLIYLRDAHVPEGKTCLRLTQKEKSSVGAVKYSKPVTFKKPNGKLHLETTIKFNITADDNNTPADGIAFFITGSLNFHKDGSNGNFGIFEPHSGEAPGLFAVVFGIFKYQWNNYPQFIAIDVKSRKPVEDTAVDKSLLVGRDVTAVINYNENEKTIQVHVDGRSEPFTTPCDLSGVLGDEVYVGISSSTGDHVALHDILSWSFDSYIVPN